MLIPRYLKGRSVVSELQSVRAAAISPAEAAGAEMAKYGAIAAGAKTVGETIGHISDVRRQAQVAKDKVALQANENYLKAGFKDLQNDPNLNLEVQEDGTPTSEYFEREAEALYKTYSGELQKIKDPETRKIAQQIAKSREQIFRADVAAEAGVIETRIATNGFYTAYNDARRADDPEGMRDLLETAIEQGLVEKGKEAESLLLDIEQTETKVQAFQYVKYIDEGFALSEEEGNQRLSELIKDTSIDKDVRDLAIDGSEERASEWGKARAKEREQQEVDAIIAYGDDNARAARGDLTYKEVDASYEAGKYGEGTGAATRRNQLTAAVTAGVKSRESQIDVATNIRNGQFIVNDKKSRDALSLYEQSATEGMGNEEAMTTIGDISRIAGTVSTQTARILNLAAVSQDAAGQVLPLYRELVSRETLQPDLHLSGDAEIFLEDASVLLESGVTPEEAVEVAWGNKTTTETERFDRAASWQVKGVESAQDGYKELIDSDWYEEKGFGDIDAPPTLMQVEYGKVYKEVFNQTGNLQTAKNLADRSTKRNWVMTNLNSPDPDEYTVQKFGIPGDSRHIRGAILREMEPERFSVRQPDGTYKTKTVDPDKVTFETFNEKADAFDVDGNQRFKVMYNGYPLARITDDGLEVATAVIDRNKLDEFRGASQEREQIENRIKDIEREERELTALSEGNVYFSDVPTPLITGAKGRKARITALGQEKAAKKKQLAGIKQVHF